MSPKRTGSRNNLRKYTSSAARVVASPTVAQMIAVGVLILVALLCSFVGDDYIAVRARDRQLTR
jgi:hypothetical protein